MLLNLDFFYPNVIQISLSRGRSAYNLCRCAAQYIFIHYLNFVVRRNIHHMVKLYFYSSFCFTGFKSNSIQVTEFQCKGKYAGGLVKQIDTNAALLENM